MLSKFLEYFTKGQIREGNVFAYDKQSNHATLRQECNFYEKTNEKSKHLVLPYYVLEEALKTVKPHQWSQREYFQ